MEIGTGTAWTLAPVDGHGEGLKHGMIQTFDDEARGRPARQEPMRGGTLGLIARRLPW
jgi:hypothetical protein